MPFSIWLSFVGIFSLGAMSPGPSLALITARTVQHGRRGGIVTALGHSLGVALYALATIAGFAVFLTQHPIVYAAVQYAGAAFLLYLGARSLLSTHRYSQQKDEVGDTQQGAANITTAQSGSPPLSDTFVAGLTIAVLNPKMAVFYLALFSQLLRTNAPPIEHAIIVVTAGIIDALWFSLVSWSLGGNGALAWLRRHETQIARVFGVLLVAIALSLILRGV